MKELSLHILDIVQNSISANASMIGIDIVEDIQANVLQMTIRDNGCGMTKETLASITNPFSTSRTTRRVGLGLPLLQAAAEQCHGAMTIASEVGQGTTVTVTFEHDHIDRLPLGDMTSTLITLFSGHPDIDFFYHHQVNTRIFECQTPEIKQELGEVPISDMDVINFLTDYLQTHIDSLYKEENA